MRRGPPGHDAATIYRQLEWRGVTIRCQIEALIAAVAICLDLPVLHRGRDYPQIAQDSSTLFFGSSTSDSRAPLLRMA